MQVCVYYCVTYLLISQFTLVNNPWVRYNYYFKNALHVRHDINILPHNILETRICFHSHPHFLDKFLVVD